MQPHRIHMHQGVYSIHIPYLLQPAVLDREHNHSIPVDYVHIPLCGEVRSVPVAQAGVLLLLHHGCGIHLHIDIRCHAC